MKPRFADFPTISSNLDLNQRVIRDRRPQTLSRVGRMDLEARIGGKPAQRRVSGVGSSVTWDICEMGRWRLGSDIFIQIK